jgi:hypothetical protein
MENEIDILGLIRELFPEDKMLTEDQVRQLMLEHARRSGSGRKAAALAGVSSSYWWKAAHGQQPIGSLVDAGYHIRHVNMWEIVED